MERNEILQAIQELSVKERMELLSEAAKENDATVVLGNGNELVKAAKSSRAVGSVQNTTPNYGLPLPSAGEVMAYQDFINTPMGIIDTALKNNADGVALNAQGLAQANLNISAADTKISNIQTNLNEWNVPGIIQEQQSMDVRLETVEETTMEFVHPDVIAYNEANAILRKFDVIKSGGLLKINAIYCKKTNGVVVPTAINYYDNTPSSISDFTMYYAGEIEGNIFNLPEVNTKYITGNFYLMFNPENVWTPISSNLIIVWNGTATNLYLRAQSSSETWTYLEGSVEVGLGIY